ncbi:MAG: Flp pilus assembly protein CpaB [Devosia sp.]
MLRRNEPLAARAEASASAVAEPPEPAAAPTFTERRQSERRGMDRLRAEALQSVISRVEDRNFNGIKERRAPMFSGRSRFKLGMQTWRIVLVVVALGAGGLAAFLATSHGPAEPAATVEVAVPAKPLTTKILVAAEAVRIGQPLAPATLVWKDWPVDAVLADYVTADTAPDATTTMAGSMARTDILAGEPIRPQKLAPAGQGFLAAILDPGQRGVSIPVNAESSSGGFIQPNDHVDVVLSRQTDFGQSSEIVLSNVRVLAVNSALGGNSGDASAEGAQSFTDRAIATLALDSMQAQVAVNAVALGKLSLALVAATDVATSVEVDHAAANAAIRMTSPFWTK